MAWYMGLKFKAEPRERNHMKGHVSSSSNCKTKTTSGNQRQSSKESAQLGAEIGDTLRSSTKQTWEKTQNRRKPRVEKSAELAATSHIGNQTMPKIPLQFEPGSHWSWNATQDQQVQNLQLALGQVETIETKVDLPFSIDQPRVRLPSEPESRFQSEDERGEFEDCIKVQALINLRSAASANAAHNRPDGMTKRNTPTSGATQIANSGSSAILETPTSISQHSNIPRKTTILDSTDSTLLVTSKEKRRSKKKFVKLDLSARSITNDKEQGGVSLLRMATSKKNCATINYRQPSKRFTPLPPGQYSRDRSVFPFFLLARELRDMIYEFSLDLNCIQRGINQYNLDPLKPDVFDDLDNRITPRIFLLNTKVYEEAQCWLRRQTLVINAPPANPNVFENEDGLALRPVIKITNFISKESITMIDKLTFHLRICKLFEAEMADPKDIPWYRPSEVGMLGLLHTTDWVFLMKVAFGAWNCRDEPGTLNIIIDDLGTIARYRLIATKQLLSDFEKELGQCWETSDLDAFIGFLTYANVPDPDAEI